MVVLETPEVEIGWHAKDFSLLGIDNQTYRLADVAGEKGLLLMFICNHCPYVQKQMTRLILASQALKAVGVGVAAICSNDAENYPEDSFEAMQKYAIKEGFIFPYLHDKTQSVAKAYGAVCTPDLFGFNAKLELQFRGRLDTSWTGLEENPTPELLPAMMEIAEHGKTAVKQHPSVGCSIKWKQSHAA